MVLNLQTYINEISVFGDKKGAQALATSAGVQRRVMVCCARMLFIVTVPLQFKGRLIVSSCYADIPACIG